MTTALAYQAYKQMLESTRAKDVTTEPVKPYKTHKPDPSFAKLGKPTEYDFSRREKAKYQSPHEKTDKREEFQDEVQVGGVVQKRDANYQEDSSAYTQYGKFKSPFYHEVSSRVSAKSGIFSTDETAVLAALDNGAKTNVSVKSDLIDLGYYTLGITEAPKIEVGMVDALTWHCYLGHYQIVRLILKRGYQAPGRYSGLSPITAAIASKNVDILKLVLSYPPLHKHINSKDGHGVTPIRAAATMTGIDPFEFAKLLIERGAVDEPKASSGEYSALMLSLLREGEGKLFSPNLFGVLISISDLDYKVAGMTVEDLAREMHNTVALKMIADYKRLGEDSINPSVTKSNLFATLNGTTAVR